jgi:Tfp pilus assembly protein PilW
MNSVLDIFGSMVIAGILFMLIIKLNLFSNQTSYTSDSELQVIQNSKTLAEIIDYDLRKIGYRHDKSSGPSIIKADSTELEFFSDIDTSGSTNTIRYYTSDSTHSAGTMNPRDIILNRTIDNGSLMSGSSLGLVKIKFTYLNASQDKIPYYLTNTLLSPYLDSIKYVKTEMWVESSNAIADAYADTSHYAVTYWEFTIYPRNI